MQINDISRHVLTGLGYSEHLNSEIIFFSLCLASIVEGDIQEPALDFLLECSSEVIHRMEFLMAVEFDSFRELLMNVFYHLVPAYFRISYSFYLPNVMIRSNQTSICFHLRNDKKSITSVRKTDREEHP